MPGYIEDRWYKKGPPRPDDSKKKPTRVKTARHGQGKRWRVAGVPGVRDRSFTVKAAAEKWLSDSQTDSSRGIFYDPRLGEITLREYVEEHWWPTVRLTPSSRPTVQNRVFNYILPFVGHHSLNQLGHERILWWQAQAEKKIDVSTLIATWRHFSAILQTAHKSRRLPVNPFRDSDLKPPSKPESKAVAWTEETVAAVWEALPARYRILLELGVGAGLRQGEAFGFSPDDIVDGEILVTRQVLRIGSRMAFGPPKGNKERAVRCAPELASAAAEYAKEFPTVAVTLPWVDPARPNVPWEDRPLRTVRLLVTRPASGQRTAGALNRNVFDDKHWKPALARAGVIPAPEVEYIEGSGKKPWARKKWVMPRHFGFHVTRHTFASVVLHAREPVTQLAAWLGHSDPALTLRTYVHFMPKTGSMGVEALDGFLSVARRGGGAVPEGADVSESPQILPTGAGSSDDEGSGAGEGPADGLW